MFASTGILLLLSCKEKYGPLLRPYVWKDSVINYTLSHDSFVLIFPTKPDGNRWFVEFYFPYEDELNKYQGPIIPRYPVVNNRITIPVDIPDSIDTKDQNIFLRAAPDNGIKFQKFVSASETRYAIFSTPKYACDKKDGFHVLSYARGNDLYNLSDSLLRSKDYPHYWLEFRNLLRDSCGR